MTASARSCRVGRVLGLAFGLLATVGGCAKGPRAGAADATPTTPASATTILPPAGAEATSDTGSRTLPVSPIGRIAPEVPPTSN